MSEPTSPYEIKPPGARRILASVAVAMVSAAALLVAFILPAEYGIDATGIGRALGLTAISEPARKIQIVDVLEGNERVREVAVPDAGEPVPLPNPAVHQAEGQPARVETVEVRLEANQETEIKAILKQNKMILYSWNVDRGTVYADFHGHDPAVSGEFFVRYQEHQEGAGAAGSLIAPFSGEHGWFWQNYNDFPVVISLTLSGYYDSIKNYGVP